MENLNNSLFSLTNTTETTLSLNTFSFPLQPNMLIFLPYSDKFRSFIQVNMSLSTVRFG